VADVVIYGGFGGVVGACLWGMGGVLCVEKLGGLEKSWLYGWGCGSVVDEIIKVMFMRHKKCLVGFGFGGG